MSSGQGSEISPRQRRILRAILPAGVLLLVLWVVWAAFMLASDSAPAWWWGSGILGLITSIVLIVSGYSYRRNLPR